MKLKLLTLSAFALFAASALPISCNKNQEPERVVPERKRPVITDGDATAKTKALFENLIDLEEKGTMFGAQIPTEYGLDGGKKWFDDGSASNSDTKYLTGSHPAVCGWTLTIVKLIGSAFVIAPVEEVFFRSFLYRRLQARDFRAVPLSRFDLSSFLWMVFLFTLEHDRPVVAALAGAAYGLLAIRFGLGSAIVAHVVTNLALGLHVICRGEWWFW